MIKKYKKKPVIIEAIQLTKSEKSVYDVLCFIGQEPNLDSYNQELQFSRYVDEVVYTTGIKIKTLEGDMIASVGDFIIKGINGEFYPCKPDIFAKTYEEVL